MKILLTGFGPFADIVDNPSARLVRHFSERGFPGHDLTTRVFPVSFARADAQARALLLNGPFDLALLMGVARNAARFRLESVAANEDRARVPNCDGESPQSVAIVPGYGQSIRTALPVHEIHAALEAAGFPADVSTDAGRYVCNRTYFAALHEICESALPTRCLFLHVPPDERSFIEPDGHPFVPFTRQANFVRDLLTLLTAAVESDAPSS
jgi:pyroglutamyl-peptidase